jgi:subtilisin family serine protease
MKKPTWLILLISILILPVSIQGQSLNQPDPLYEEQWPLINIGYEKTSLSQQKVANKIVGKKIVTPKEVIVYEEKPFSAASFILQLPSTQIRRLSIELANPQGSWTVEVRDSHNKLLTHNTSTYKRIDLLLPNDADVTDLAISLKKAEGNWEETPIIKKLLGVNSSIIAVIDSGVALEHEDFCDNILYSLGKDYREGMSLPVDRNGHGTHVTGIIAACNQNGVGVSGAIGGAEVDVIPLKVLGADGLTDDFILAEAVQKAIQLEVDVINISIAGVTIKDEFRKAVRNALLLGIPVVAAAGNGNNPTENIFPASLPGVIAVASVTQYGKKVPRSNYGWEVDISAPGYEILSTYTSPSYQKLTGTSMAAPFVASVIAHYKTLNPQLDFVQINRLLARSALDLGVKGYDIYTGAGLVQFSKDVSHLEKIDWLNVKDNQPIENKSELVLGFSRELVGNSVLIFKDEKFFKTMKVAEMIEEISLEDTSFMVRDNSLVAVVVDERNHVLDSSVISVTNSKMAMNFGEFKDIAKSHWAYEEIIQATSAKLVKGYPDGNFKPSDSISRRQSLMMLNRLFPSTKPSSLSIPFKDVTLSTSGVLAILTGAEKGYIKGINGFFQPEQKLSRGQMALIIARALELTNSSHIKLTYNFKDVPKNSEYFSAVQALTELGIITKQSYFRPNETITRAQFAAMLIRTQQILTNK